MATPPTTRGPAPDPSGSPSQRQSQRADEFLYSPAFQATGNVAFGIAPELTWDAYIREVYQKVDALLQRQANEMIRCGGYTREQVHILSAQRDEMRIEMRRQLGPFGERWSLLKGRNQPDFESRLIRKGSLEAVLRSVGKTNVGVNRMTFVMKVIGRGAIVLQITASLVLIVRARPEDRARVASGQIGGIAGGAVGGTAGAWAGCTTLAALAAPSLIFPIVGEGVETGACFIGGIAGGLGVGFLGFKMGESAGEGLYDYVTTITYLKR